MKIVAISVALWVSGIMAAGPATAATKVFLLAGQSNMAGHETGLPAAPYNATQPVQFWNSSNNGWVNLKPGYGCTTNDIEPEVGFGYALHNSILPNDDIYLVKWGVDSTSLAGPWNPNGSGRHRHEPGGCGALQRSGADRFGRTLCQCGRLGARAFGACAGRHGSAGLGRLLAEELEPELS